jgi:hypothetical protein
MLKNHNKDYYLAKEGNKICKKCERKLPSNSDYYFLKNDIKDGFMSICKECSGYKFTNKLTNIPKVGYKFCIKCSRELLIDIKYFPIDNLCKDGFRNICRECSRDGHFMKEGYKPKTWWTKEDEELFNKIYAHYTNEEIIKLFFPNETSKSLMDKAYRMGKINKTDETAKRADRQGGLKTSGEKHFNFGKQISNEIKEKISISKTGKYLGENSWFYGKKQSIEQRTKISKYRKQIGLWNGKKNPRHLKPLSGKYNGRWSGGIKELYYDLRDHIQEWRKSSMEECNYKCFLTGKEFDNVHHLYSFKNIVYEIFKELQLPMLQTIGEYSEEDRNNIYELLNNKHKYYGKGRCLCKTIHKLFHDTYNYTNNTPEQFKEFEQRYHKFEFDDLLEGKYKYKNILGAVS